MRVRVPSSPPYMRVYPSGLREWIATPLFAGSNPVTRSKLDLKGMSVMKVKTSKFQAEWVMGRMDVPYKKAKKIEKGMIKRKRRTLEKREAQSEISEALI